MKSSANRRSHEEGAGHPQRKTPIELVPKDQRVAKGTTTVRTVIEVPRCAVRTKVGQCGGVVGGSGAASGFVEIDGENVPFCGRHYTAAGGTVF